MIKVTKDKPCKYAEALGSDYYECIAHSCGVGCDKIVIDCNQDGTINVVNCGLEEGEDKK